MTKRVYLLSASLPTRPGLMEAEIVLCKLPENTTTPFVTWQRNTEDGSTYWGHYHSCEDDARKEFYERCAEKNAGPVVDLKA